MGFGNSDHARNTANNQDSARTREMARKFELSKVFSEESFLGRFAGGPDEPYTMAVHDIDPGTGNWQDKEPVLCVNPDNAPGGFCAACARRNSRVGGDFKKAVGPASTQLSFTFISMRQVITGKVRGNNGQPQDVEILIHDHADEPSMMWFQPQTEQGQKASAVQLIAKRDFPYFRRDDPTQVIDGFTLRDEGLVILGGGGAKSFVKAKMGRAGLGAAILACERAAKSYCQCGGASKAIGGGPARVQAQGFSCSCCRKPLTLTSSYGERIICPFCSSEMVPTEQLGCSAGCDSPRRADITDGYVRITKRGKDVNTTWHCDFYPQKAAPHHQEILDLISAGKRPIPKPSELYVPSNEAIEQVLVASRIPTVPRGFVNSNVAGPLPFQPGAAPAFQVPQVPAQQGFHSAPLPGPAAMPPPWNPQQPMVTPQIAPAPWNQQAVSPQVAVPAPVVPTPAAPLPFQAGPAPVQAFIPAGPVPAPQPVAAGTMPFGNPPAVPPQFANDPLPH